MILSRGSASVTTCLDTLSRGPFLMRAIEAGHKYDFCFIDGAHTWDTDGFAFCLVDRMLRPGGWIIFDDLNWTHAHSPTLANRG